MLDIIRCEINAYFKGLIVAADLRLAEPAYAGIESFSSILEDLRLLYPLLGFEYKCLILAAFDSLLHSLSIHLDWYVKLLGNIVEYLLVSLVSPHGAHSLLGALSGVAESEAVQSCL